MDCAGKSTPNNKRTRVSAAIRRMLSLIAAAATVATILAAYRPTGQQSTPTASGGSAILPATLTLVAYTAPREVYATFIIPEFQKEWKAQHGQEVKFNQSYLGIGAKSRAIIAGFEADAAALSLNADIKRIQEAGLIKHDW